MKMTLVLGENGELIAAQHGPIRHPAPGGEGSGAGAYAGPRQKLHEVDVPDHMAKIQDHDEFLKQIKPHLPKK